MKGYKKFVIDFDSIKTIEDIKLIVKTLDLSFHVHKDEAAFKKYSDSPLFKENK